MRSNVIQMVFTPNNTMTGTATISTNAIPVDQIYGFAIQAVWTGTSAGTLKLQASSDPAPKSSNVSTGGPYAVTNWTDVTNSSTAVVSGGGNFMWNFNGAFYNYVRLVYTNSSGTGAITAEICVKGA